MQRFQSILSLLALSTLLASCGGSGGGGGGAPTPPGNGGGPILPPGIDADQDGVADQTELDGWDIVVDYQGYGTGATSLLTTVHVTADPTLVDTDGDGLTDYEEFVAHSDPRTADTDADQLSDFDEVRRWQTIPYSVDSDGDARGPDQDLPPNSDLFDGNELTDLGTSPTLRDTDGDNRTDYEEADDPFFRALVADLPQAEILVEGALDVRLNVEYAEEAASSFEYGSSQSSSATTTTGSSTATTTGTHSTFSWGLAQEVSYPWSASVSANQQWTDTQINETTTTTSSEFAAAAEQSYSEYQTDSQSYTETYAAGSIRMGIRIRNAGLSAFELTNLGITVLSWVPGADPLSGQFRTLATLTPELSSVTLGVGSPPTPILEVSSTDVDASIIKEFLRHPSSLVLQPSIYDLVNQDDIDYDFLNENTFTRTALFEIDLGDGDVRTARVATNVERGPDGEYLGVRVERVLEILGYERGDAQNGYVVQTPPGSAREILTGLEGQLFEGTAGEAPQRFWTIIGSRPEHSASDADFSDLRLVAGDQLRLVYTEDLDQDGVHSMEEAFHGTSDQLVDSDGDGVSDFVELKEGYLVGNSTLAELGYPARVRSDARSSDSDLDGLTDGEELALGTDPLSADTDQDTLRDADDPYPLIPSIRLHVAHDAAPGGDGLSWETAFHRVQDALADAELRNTPGDGDPLNDANEIWVKRGTYRPTDSLDRAVSFQLVSGVTLLGGFEGDEERRGERDSNPQTGGTILSGDLDGADSSGSTGDNSWSVVYAGPEVDASAVLDGFVIRGGHSPEFYEEIWTAPEAMGGGIYSAGAPTLRNLYVVDNFAEQGGGGFFQAPVPVGSPAAHLSECIFEHNGTDYQGGAVHATWNVIEDCQFVSNGGGGNGGGGIMGVSEGLVVRRSSFIANTGFNGGAVLLFHAARFEDCAFEDNLAVFDFFTPDNTSYQAAGGGACYFYASAEGMNLVFVNCLFRGNRGGSGGAILARTSGSGSRIHLIGCTLSDNGSLYHDGGSVTTAGGIDNPSTGSGATRVVLRNSILFGNWREDGSGARVYGLSGQYQPGTVESIEYSCVEGGSNAGTNTAADPSFLSPGSGDLRLSPGSPCVDTGFSLVDVDPDTPFDQLLPALDLDGNPRIVDGDSSGGPRVDMGAYELQN